MRKCRSHAWVARDPTLNVRIKSWSRFRDLLLFDTYGDQCYRFSVTTDPDFSSDPLNWIKKRLLRPLQTLYLSELPSLDQGSEQRALELALRLLENRGASKTDLDTRGLL